MEFDPLSNQIIKNALLRIAGVVASPFATFPRSLFTAFALFLPVELQPVFGLAPRP